MEEDISIASIAVNTTLIFAAALLILRRLRRKKRRVWVREILCKRRQEGAHHLLIRPGMRVYFSEASVNFFELFQTGTML